MNKKIIALIVLLCAIVSFSSCVDNDDDSTVSEEWKAYNDKQVREASSNTEYTPRASISGNGSVYWKPITDFIPGDEPSIDVYPIFTDSVSVRYEGWIYQLDGTKYTFDTTEGDYNGIPKKRYVNNTLFVDGFRTMLQYMKIDEQVEVCIPYLLGYGTTGSYSGSVQIIPGYTTLWFKIKLMNIYDDRKKEWIKK